jgi:hypothetical protein
MRGRDHGGTSEAAKEALFLSRFLDELGHAAPPSPSIEMGMDNQATVSF